MKRRVTFFLVGATAALLASCDVLAPPPPVVPPLQPGFVLSRPFPEIRGLNDVAVVAFNDERITNAYAVGTDGTVLAYNGSSWLDESPAITEHLESVSGVVDAEGNETVLAVGANGVILQRVDGSWGVLVSPVTEQLFGVWVRSNNDAFIVGDRGTVLRWDGTAVKALVDELKIDTGTVDEAGQPIVFAISDPLKSVMGQSENDVWTVGPRGVVYHYDGTRFVLDDSQTNRPLADVFTRAGIWAATTDGVLLRRRDDGWADNCEDFGTARENCAFLAPAPVFLQGIWARNDGDVFAVGLSENLFHFEDGQWSLSFVEEQSELRAIDGAELPRAADAAEDSPALREVIAVGAGGRIVRGPLVLPHAGETLIDTRAAIVPEEE